MKIIGIYKILNLITGIFYIGCSIDIKQRFRAHKSYLKLNCHSNVHLQLSWNKHGEKAFKFIILEQGLNKIELKQREQFWIDKTKCYDNKIGYNKRKLSDHNFGVVQSPETIAKRVAKLKGQKRTAEVKAKLSLLAKGRKFSEETKVKLRGRKRSREVVEKHANIMRGRKHTAEHKRKISESGKGRRPTEATRLKLSMSRLGNEARRNKNKWPHELGCRCKCRECMKKKSSNLQLRRQHYRLPFIFICAEA